jgi:uncharacterized protein YqjF (DUF2071 family)
MKAETTAFERNAKKDGFTYWAEISNGSWMLFRRGINWKNPDLVDDHTGKPIQSAYAEDQKA